MGFLSAGREERLQVLFFSSASISFAMASLQFGDLTAWVKVRGSSVEQILERKALCATNRLEV